ncbi:MAG: multicopper oxidase domain-containing protein [Gemmatimonadota bacterium]
MRVPIVTAAALALLGPAIRWHHATPAPVGAAPAVAANTNRTPAGVLVGGTLTVALEVRRGEWRPDGANDPGLVVHAFAEVGKTLQAPGPLLRVVEGTVIEASVHNTLASDTVLVRGLSTRGVHDATDSLLILPGATRRVQFTAGAPGTYYYTGTTAPSRPAITASARAMDAVLSGAFVIDPRTAPRRVNDRVLVLSMWHPTLPANGAVGRTDLLRFAVNGKAWPNTERLTYDLGDSVRFRVINTSAATHPMHLHGFYFSVDARGDGSVDSVHAAARTTAPPQMVVTERLIAGRTIAITWVPERTGNWMFHCHDNYHVLRNRPLDGTAIPAEHQLHVQNHAMEMMGGLVMGITVRGREARNAVATAARRRLRLIAAVDSGGTDAEPAYGYVLQEGRTTGAVARPTLPGPVMVLQRGQPVGITVVNAIPEATAVHWHGIELESYYDGVVDYSGAGTRLTPAIAPRDSFEARFTPPRAGTFIYHPHADEVRQQQAGLSGVLIVVDSLSRYDPATDIPLLISVPRREAEHASRVFINGSAAPPALDLRVGTRYRFRLVNIHTFRPNMIARLLRDSTLLSWQPIAKDGMPLPAPMNTQRPAMQQMGNGETFDFTFTPSARGDYRFTVSASSGALLASLPLRVH